MILNIYAVKDSVAGDFPFTFKASNDGMMERVVKGALLSKEQNVFTTDIKDKSIYCIGTYETSTADIKPLSPVFCCNVNEIRLKLIQEIKIAKQEAGVEQPTAEEVPDEND